MVADGPRSRDLAVVPGGGGAIGEAICRALHGDGWMIAVGYVTRDRAESLARELDPLGETARAVPLDMTDPAQIRATTTALLEEFGRVDAVVFNAGAARDIAFVDSTEDDWAREVAVNFLGPALIVKLTLPAMIAARRGVFVGVTSEAAKVGNARQASYAASKAALMAFFKTIVREHGRDGVRANCVAPGPIDTPMLRTTFESPEAAEKAIAKLVRLVPMGRLGGPGEVAAAVRFFCSGAAFVAGEQLSVGGGVSMNS